MMWIRIRTNPYNICTSGTVHKTRKSVCSPSCCCRGQWHNRRQNVRGHTHPGGHTARARRWQNRGATTRSRGGRNRGRATIRTGKLDHRVEDAAAVLLADPYDGGTATAGRVASRFGQQVNSSSGAEEFRGVHPDLFSTVVAAIRMVNRTEETKLHLR